MSDSRGKGFAAAGGAFLLWGLVPIYWKTLAQVNATELILHRVVWSVLLLWVLIAVRGRTRDFLRALSSVRSIIGNGVAGLLLSANWLIYIWAVNAGRVIDTSLGYFLVPFVSAALGYAVLHERLNRAQVFAMALALTGVAIQIARAERFPWVGLGLAATFGLYGLMRKRSVLGSLTGLGVETTILAPVAAALLIYLHRDGGGALGRVDVTTHILLFGTALVTTVPLLLFSMGARLIPLASVGLLQFITPSCSLLLGLFLYGEPLPPARLISFLMIWTGLAVYVIDLRRNRTRVSIDPAEGR